MGLLERILPVRWVPDASPAHGLDDGLPHAPGRADLPGLLKGLDSAGLRAVPKSFEFDPYDAAHQTDLVEDRHGGTAGVPYSTLAYLASAEPVVCSIIATRVAQVAAFCEPFPDEHSLGFEVQLRDRKRTPTRAERKRIVELTDWLTTCGDPRVDMRWDLESFTRAVIRDSLTYDQLCFEKVRTRGGKPAGFIPADAGTIRYARPSPEEVARGRRDPKSIAYVQVVRGQIRADFTPAELSFGIRNPRTLLAANGYGNPEVADLLKVIVWLLQSYNYQAGNFTHGIHSAALIAIVSKMTPSVFKAFRRKFYSMLAGASKAHKTPVIRLNPDNKEDIKSVQLGKTNVEMEHSQWHGLLMKHGCARYQMDPAELGFVFGAEGQTGALTQQGPAERISGSRERGLKPLTKFYFRQLDEVVRAVDPAYRVVPVGFDAESRTERLEALVKRVQHFMTVNEVRAELDLPKLDDGEVVLNQVWLSAKQAAEAATADGAAGDMTDTAGGAGDQVSPDGGLDPSMLFGDAEPESTTTARKDPSDD